MNDTVTTARSVLRARSIIIIGVESQDKLNKMNLPKELDGYPVNIQVMATIRAQ